MQNYMKLTKLQYSEEKTSIIWKV